MNKLTIIIILVTFFSPHIVNANELQARQEITNEVKILFSNEDFDKLEKLSTEYLDNKTRTSSGKWKLSLLYHAFYKLSLEAGRNRDYWNIILDQSDAWIKKYPSSSTALIVKGNLLDKYAWSIRGGNYASSVPNEDMSEFNDKLKVAKEYMLKIKEKADHNPGWYTAMSEIMKGLGEKEEVFMNLINEGTDKHPQHYPIYFSAVHYLSPQWHGSKEKIELFAKDAVEKTKELEGKALYARIYWYASEVTFSSALFSKSDVVWPDMKEGINDVLKEYPDQWNINNFAYFACLVRDQKMTVQLVSKIKEPLIRQVWKTKGFFEFCQEMTE